MHTGFVAVAYDTARRQFRGDFLKPVNIFVMPLLTAWPAGFGFFLLTIPCLALQFACGNSLLPLAPYSFNTATHRLQHWSVHCQARVPLHLRRAPYSLGVAIAIVAKCDFAFHVLMNSGGAA